MNELKYFINISTEVLIEQSIFFLKCQYIKGSHFNYIILLYEFSLVIGILVGYHIEFNFIEEKEKRIKINNIYSPCKALHI